MISNKEVVISLKPRQNKRTQITTPIAAEKARALPLWQNREQHSAEAEEVIAEPITLPGDRGKNKTKTRTGPQFNTKMSCQIR